MYSLFRKIILLWLVLLTPFLFADEDTTYIHISNASANEATGKMTFTVTIDALPLSILSPVRVGFQTIDGTAKIDENDYTEKDSADILTPAVWFFSNSGSTSKTIEIDVLDDTIYESSEYFYLKITTSTNGHAISGTGIATGTITDDDVQPLELDRFYNRSVIETDGDQILSMVAYFNQNIPNPITLTYHTQDGSAIAGSDYTDINNTINISANSSQVILPITIKGDLSPEITKNFKVIIDSISEGTVTDSEATTTIYDDDTIEVDVSCSDVAEGNEGESNNVECEIYLANNKPLPVGVADFTVDYTSQDGSADSATAGDDYTAISGTVTFTTGDEEHIVNIPTIGDNNIEPDENVRLFISGSDYIIDHDSEAEILNDDGSYPAVNFSTADVSIVEGNSSTKALSFHFELDADAVAESSFEYYTQDDDAKVSDNDYVEINTTVYNIPIGTRAIDIEVTINGDTQIEHDETFYLKFKSENKITISGHTAKGNIINDDGSFPSIKFDIPSYETQEGDSNQTELNITMTLNKPALANSRLDYYTFDYSAKLSNNDYVEKTYYKHFFSGGETNLTIPLIINGDTEVELDEYFYFKIATVADSNITIDGTDAVKINILNDDGNLSEFYIEASTLIFDEKDNNKTRVDFTIKLDTPAQKDGITIEYLTVNGSAGVDDLDFDKIITTTAIFNTGEQNKTFSTYINGDTHIEPDENFFIKLQNPHNATLASSPNSQIEIIIINDDAHNEEAFTCDSSMYISSSIKRGSGSTGKMWLHKIDTTQNPFAFNVVDDSGETKLYNALAYADSDSGDINTSNYIFGLYKKKLVKLSRTGKVTSLGNVAGLPHILTTKQLFAGAIFGNEYYISGPGQDYDKIFKINLSDKNVTEITLDTAISLLDFSFTPDGNYLHGIIDGGELVKIDLTVTPSTVTTIGSAHIGYQFDSTFSDKNGRFFANDSQGNGFFEFDLTTGEKLFLSASQQASFNDGANCLKAELLFNDYGDAPIGYGEPRHTIANGIFMGSEVDHDINPFDTIDANGDDTNGIDDEDGFTFLDGTDINGSYFEVNGTQELNITVSKDGYLNAWLDFGIDGTFVGDQIITALALTAGSHTIGFNIPSNVTKNQQTYIRFRYSSTANLDFEESATDGEVEDYAIKFGTAFQGIKGRFNIQRTNSALNAKDFALYTQIVGRDFNYHVVFYDENLTQEKELIKVPVKIDLIDANKPMDAPLYTDYYYFSHSIPKSRTAVLDASDLDNLPATKEALFKITYAINANGSIVQQECGADYKNCFETLMGLSDAPRTNEAEDKFAIRPETFYIKIADGDKERINSRHANKTLKVASGYEYNLTFIATQHGGVEPSFGYNEEFNSSFDFNATALINCADTTPIEQTISYIDGIKNIPDFTHNNVGHYSLTQATDENWTVIDREENHCIVNSSTTSADGNSKSGCNIKLQTHPLILEFYPDHFDVNLTLQNLPSSGHPNFIYMSELNSTYNEVAIAFQGEIIAQSENNITTTNFTAGCMATNLLLDLNASTISVEGTDQDIKTIKGTNVDFSRVIHFNTNSSSPTLELNQTLSRIGRVATINSDKFLDENNGTVTIDMRYNLNKHLREPINPIEVSFHGIGVESTDANSVAHDKVNISSNIHTPLGEELFTTNNQKNFYFARVVSDLQSYPRVNLNISPLVRTPLNVDIYCKTPLPNYCEAREIINNTNLTGTTREQGGWYLSSQHHTELDGNVTKLEATPNIVTIVPNPLNPITLPNGENGLVTETFINCSSPQSIINITTSPALTFEPSQYVLNCSDQNASQWTGVGNTGNILNVKPKVNNSGKIDW